MMEASFSRVNKYVLALHMDGDRLLLQQYGPVLVLMILFYIIREIKS
jgi:hypothetical protein